MNSKEDILSHQECETILTRYFGDRNFVLVTFKIVPLIENIEGLGSKHYIIKTHVKRNEEVLLHSFFAKISARKYELQPEAFQKETFFYEKLISEFKIYCPTFEANILPNFYLSRDSNLVVMENLQRQDYCVAPFEDTLDIKHIKLVLKVLAKLHSACIIYEERKSEELGKPFQLIDKYEEFLRDGLFKKDENYLGYKWHKASQKGIISIIDKMPEMEISKSEFKEKFYALSESSCEIVKPSKKYRNVVCHGDLWRKNFLFQYESNIPANCKLIDFQLMKYSPPAYDVLKLIYQATTAGMRKQHFEDLLKYYYDNLCKELTLGDVDASAVLSRDQFQASVKYLLPQCKVETSYYYSFQKLGRDCLKELMSGDNLEDLKSVGDCTQVMLKHYQDGSVYKKWMDEIMFDIKDMLAQHGFTREDCYAILRSKLNTTDYDLVKYEVKGVDEKSGFLGEHFKIRMNINHKNTNTDHFFFAKMLPDTAWNSFAIQTGAFDNEKFMFDQVFKKMSLFGIKEIYECVPKCYYSLPNDILVFEDLDALGFKTANRHKPFDLEHISVVIKSLAQLHASVLILEEKLTKINGQVFRVENQYSKDLSEVVYGKTEGHLGLNMILSAIKGIFTTIDLIPDLDSSITNNQFKQLIKKFYESTMYELTQPSKKYRNVLCHSDLWPANIMLKYDSGKPVDCRLVDYQIVRVCPPAKDVMALLHLTTTRKFRANFMADVIELYHKELATVLARHSLDVEDIIPFIEFVESCEEYKVFAINQASTHIPLTMMKTEDMLNIFADQELCHRTFFIDRSEFLKTMFEKDESYKYYISESIKDLRILCESIAVKAHE